MLKPRIEVAISPNRVSARNLESGASAYADAPFSCSHFLVEDVDILEHAVHGALKQVAGGGFLPSFPIVEISTAGRLLHGIERKIIRDAVLNAGASEVEFAPSTTDCTEQAEAHAAYVAAAKRQR